MDSVLIGTAIIAVTEALKRAIPSISGIITIIVAGVLGLLTGLVGLGGLNWVSGIIVGLSAAGGVKVATSFSGK